MTNRIRVTVPAEYHNQIREFTCKRPDGTWTIDIDLLKRLDEANIPWKIEGLEHIIQLLAELGASELARRDSYAKTNQG